MRRVCLRGMQEGRDGKDERVAGGMEDDSC